MILQQLTEASSWRLCITTACALLAVYVGSAVWRGLQQRWRFIKMIKDGIPVPEPYSMLWGHLMLMQSIKKTLPSDAHGNYIQIHMISEWQKYFPRASSCPPLIYLDLWPFMEQPMIMVISPDACAQLTQDTPQPRHTLLRWGLTPLTGGLDLLSMDQSKHGRWRQRLLPAFSPRNIEANIDPIMDRVEIFADKLQAKATNGSSDWGDVFELYDMAVSLTFDVIVRFAIGLDLDEQRSGSTSTPMVTSFMYLMSQVKVKTLIASTQRMLPWTRSKVAYHQKVIQDLILPQIETAKREVTSCSSSQRETIMHHGLREFKDGSEPDQDFIDHLVSNSKLLLLAGHDSAAQTLCWTYRELCRRPDALEKLREEHTHVFGANLKQTGQLIRKTPNILHQLPYTIAVIKETLRLHNIAGTFRAASPGFMFTIDGTNYPAYDALVLTQPSVMHLRDDLWPRALEFLPERFLAPDGDPLQPPKNAWRPFELGNTRCIGLELAMVELKLALVLTVRDLDLKVDLEAWTQQRQQEGKTGVVSENHIALEAANGDTLYRVGDGVGRVKGDLPMRVAVRDGR